MLRILVKCQQLLHEYYLHYLSALLGLEYSSPVFSSANEFLYLKGGG